MALPLKTETFRPLAATVDIFFIEGVGYGAFRGGSRYHHRGCHWLYKGWAKATSRRRKKQSKTEGRNPTKQRERKYIEPKKTEKTRTKKPKKTNINIVVSSIPPANQRKKEPKQQAVTFIIIETKGKQKGAVIYRRERNHRAASLLAISRSR
jgi:hypothetical protein